MERAEGANEGPERSQARTKQRKPSQKVILICLQHEHLSTEVSRDTSRDMAGEVGRDPLLHRQHPDTTLQKTRGLTGSGSHGFGCGSPKTDPWVTRVIPYLYSRSVLRFRSLLPTVVDWVQVFEFSL